MREEYDFTNAIKNPYAKKSNKTNITIRLDTDTVDYFKNLSEELGIPYQTLMNLFLKDCVKHKKQPNLEWV